MGSADNRPLTRLLAACETLLSDVGEASMRTVAMEALTAYADLGDDGKLQFFAHVCTAYDVDAEQVAELGEAESAFGPASGGFEALVSGEADVLAGESELVPHFAPEYFLVEIASEKCYQSSHGQLEICVR